MKQYVVLKLYQYSTPDVVISLNDEKDAITYAEIMKRNDPDHDYVVYRLNEKR